MALRPRWVSPRGALLDSEETVRVQAESSRAKVEQVKQLFVEAEGFFQTGRYDLALKRSEQILNLDQYNIAARKFQEKVNKAIDEYANASYNETRSRFVRNLDKAWAMPIRRFNLPSGAVVEQSKTELSRTELTTRKLERIIIPKLDFRDATIREAIEFLKKKSAELDNDPDIQRRGVSFELRCYPLSSDQSRLIALEGNGGNQYVLERHDRPPITSLFAGLSATSGSEWDSCERATA